MIRAKGYPTLKDVARMAQCSPAVASTVINGARGNTVVGKAMRERVMRVAAELGYRSNFASRSLVQQRTRTLGIYIPPSPWSGLGYSYDDTILRGVEGGCREHGYDLLLLNMTGSQPPRVCLEKFAERRIDGLILIHVEVGAPWLPELIRRNRNIVAVDYSCDAPEVDAIMFNNAAVGQLVVDHLVEQGHRRIGFVGSCRSPVNRDAAIRLEGFRRAIASLGLELRPEWIFDDRLMSKPLSPNDAVCQIEGREAARHAVALGKEGPTAWIAYSDLVAVMMLGTLKASGVAVPRDLSIVGVDDSELCRMVDPPLTSVGHPLREMGRLAVDRLVAGIGRQEKALEGAAGMKTMLDPTLVVRESTAITRSVVPFPGL